MTTYLLVPLEFQWMFFVILGLALWQLSLYYCKRMNIEQFHPELFNENLAIKLSFILIFTLIIHTIWNYTAVTILSWSLFLAILAGDLNFMYLNFQYFSFNFYALFQFLFDFFMLNFPINF